MKKLFTLTILLMVFMVAPNVVLGDTVTTNRVSGYYSGIGGEFTLFPSAGLQWVLSDYVEGVTKNIWPNSGPNFQTFCIEANEYINIPGGPYEAVLNDGAVYGGNGGLYDPISVGTAWLYHQFQLGILAGYDYNAPTSDRDDDAGALQKAIWFLEGESGGVNNYYVTLAINNFGGLLSNAQADNFQNGQRQIPVMVLNLWDVGHVNDPCHKHQDQLVCTPVPEPATMLLLGSGLIGLAGFARRRFKK